MREWITRYRPSMLAAQDTVSIGQALFIASIPATIALLGVIVTVAVGQWRAAKASKEDRDERKADRDHQARLDRDRFMRTERIAAYRTLTQAAGNILLQGALSIVPGDPRPLNAAAEGAWTAALAEVQLVGAVPVILAAQAVEGLRKGRLYQQAMVQYLREHADADETLVGRWEKLSEERQGDQMTLFDRLIKENEDHLLALINACRADIASLED